MVSRGGGLKGKNDLVLKCDKKRRREIATPSLLKATTTRGLGVVGPRKGVETDVVTLIRKIHAQTRKTPLIMVWLRHQKIESKVSN